MESSFNIETAPQGTNLIPFQKDLQPAFYTNSQNLSDNDISNHSGSSKNHAELEDSRSRKDNIDSNSSASRISIRSQDSMEDPQIEDEDNGELSPKILPQQQHEGTLLSQKASFNQSLDKLRFQTIQTALVHPKEEEEDENNINIKQNLHQLPKIKSNQKQQSSKEDEENSDRLSCTQEKISYSSGKQSTSSIKRSSLSHESSRSSNESPEKYSAFSGTQIDSSPKHLDSSSSPKTIKNTSSCLANSTSMKQSESSKSYGDFVKSGCLSRQVSNPQSSKQQVETIEDWQYEQSGETSKIKSLSAQILAEENGIRLQLARLIDQSPSGQENSYSEDSLEEKDQKLEIGEDSFLKEVAMISRKDQAVSGNMENISELMDEFQKIKQYCGIAGWRANENNTDTRIGLQDKSGGIIRLDASNEKKEIEEGDGYDQANNEVEKNQSNRVEAGTYVENSNKESKEKEEIIEGFLTQGQKNNILSGNRTSIQKGQYPQPVEGYQRHSNRDAFEESLSLVQRKNSLNAKSSGVLSNSKLDDSSMNKFAGTETFSSLPEEKGRESSKLLEKMRQFNLELQQEWALARKDLELLQTQNVGVSEQQQQQQEEQKPQLNRSSNFELKEETRGIRGETGYKLEGKGDANELRNRTQTNQDTKTRKSYRDENETSLNAEHGDSLQQLKQLELERLELQKLIQLKHNILHNHHHASHPQFISEQDMFQSPQQTLQAQYKQQQQQQELSQEQRNQLSQFQQCQTVDLPKTFQSNKMSNGAESYSDNYLSANSNAKTTDKNENSSSVRVIEGQGEHLDKNMNSKRHELSKKSGKRSSLSKKRTPITKEITKESIPQQPLQQAQHIQSNSKKNSSSNKSLNKNTVKDKEREKVKKISNSDGLNSKENIKDVKAKNYQGKDISMVKKDLDEKFQMQLEDINYRCHLKVVKLSDKLAKIEAENAALKNHLNELTQHQREQFPYGSSFSQQDVRYGLLIAEEMGVKSLEEAFFKLREIQETKSQEKRFIACITDMVRRCTSDGNGNDQNSDGFESGVWNGMQETRKDKEFGCENINVNKEKSNLKQSWKWLKFIMEDYVAIKTSGKYPEQMNSSKQVQDMQLKQEDSEILHSIMDKLHIKNKSEIRPALEYLTQNQTISNSLSHHNQRINNQPEFNQVHASNSRQYQQLPEEVSQIYPTIYNSTPLLREMSPSNRYPSTNSIGKNNNHLQSPMSYIQYPDQSEFQTVFSNNSVAPQRKQRVEAPIGYSLNSNVFPTNQNSNQISSKHNQHIYRSPITVPSSNTLTAQTSPPAKLPSSQKGSIQQGYVQESIQKNSSGQLSSPKILSPSRKVKQNGKN